MDTQLQIRKQLPILVGAMDVAIPSYVLIDPLLGDPVHWDSAPDADLHNLTALTRARDAAWARDTYAVVLPKAIALPLHQQPYLVALQDRNDVWLESTLEFAFAEAAQAQQDGLAGTGQGAHRVGGWLQSSLAPALLVEQLAKMMCVNTQAITQARYQRLADRRTLGWLRAIVGDARLCAALGRIQRWAYLDAGGQLAQLRSTAESCDALHLSRDEWPRFMLGETLHPALARWLGEVAPGATDAATLYSRTAAALQQADAAARAMPQRFVQAQDRVAWAAMLLAYPGIEQDPMVRKQLAVHAPSDEPIDTIYALCATLRDLYTAIPKTTP